MDNWDYRFKNWINKKKKRPMEKSSVEKNKVIIKEYDKEEKLNIEEAKSKNAFNTLEVIDKRRFVLFLLFIILLFVFVFLTIVFR